MNKKLCNFICIFITILISFVVNSYALNLAETNLKKLAKEDANSQNVGTLMLLGTGYYGN